MVPLERDLQTERPTSNGNLNGFLRGIAAAGNDLASVLRQIGGARPLFDACDVSVALHDPRADVAAPGRPWFAKQAPEGISACLHDPAEGHAPLRTLRRLGTSVARFDERPDQPPHHGRRTAYLRALAAAGYARVLIGHLGDRESLGRIEWYRTAESSPFDENDEIRLRLLLPGLAAAIRKGSFAVADREMALVNAAGAVLWASDGFRFVWNGACDSPIVDRRLPLSTMLDEPMLARTVAVQVLDLADPSGGPDRGTVFGRVGRSGRRPTAEWRTLPGGPYGCAGRVMLLTLRRVVTEPIELPGPQHRPPAATPK